ncbi:hypothetical protein ACFLX5_00325 [Chloroflexota bacterium]
MISITDFIDSGLLHHLQLSGHPFINTVVRIPGPSCRENFWMLNINPFPLLSAEDVELPIIYHLLNLIDLTAQVSSSTTLPVIDIDNR